MGGRKQLPGKISASLNERMDQVEWGEFEVGSVFRVVSSKKKFDANKVKISSSGKFPYIVRMSASNGQKGFLNEDEKFLNEGNTISFGQDTATVFYQEKPYFTGDKIKILKPLYKEFNKKNAPLILAALQKAFGSFSWGRSSFHVSRIEKQKMLLPVTAEKDIDFAFMECFVAELEKERIEKLSSYLKMHGFERYELSDKEKQALKEYDHMTWRTYRLEALFGKSTRGRRLKSADRVAGTLPFATAGEANEGISDFIGNRVHIFSKNTTTIDMFGSAKYRNYDYGGDDHIAVVHTENLSQNAAIFVTAAIHKASHNGQFHYGRNFYSKDADELQISLPEKDGEPDFERMDAVMSAVHKLVFRNVIVYMDERTDAAKGDGDKAKLY